MKFHNYVPPNSGPIFQCVNGHVTCKSCIPKAKNCPICRNESDPVRNLILEKILTKFGNLEANNQLSSTSNLTNLKWDSSRGYHSDTENDDFDGVNETDEENESDEIVNVYEITRRIFEAAFFEHSRWINEAVQWTFNGAEEFEETFKGYLKFLYRLCFISFSMIFNPTIMTCLIILTFLAANVCISI